MPQLLSLNLNDFALLVHDVFTEFQRLAQSSTEPQIQHRFPATRVVLGSHSSDHSAPMRPSNWSREQDLELTSLVDVSTSKFQRCLTNLTDARSKELEENFIPDGFQVFRCSVLAQVV